MATLTIEEIVKLGAIDTEIFARHFFPKTLRQASPVFAKPMWQALDDPTKRFVNLPCFRGSAKTSRLRIFAAKRIAYSLSHTVLYIGASEDHAIRSLDWLRNAIERNPRFAGTFRLKPGAKWNETDREIINESFGTTTWVKGVGITGNIRGINFDDYRPDLIILDDVITDENAATLEQREKVKDLILGAVANSLAPATEEPNAKMANLQTPIHSDDAAAEMAKSKMWSTYTCSCWTKETEESPVDEQVSSWPERYPTDVLRAEKKLALEENRYSKWAREMECKLISVEMASFRAPWLGVYDAASAPRTFSSVLIIDPVPPPSKIQIAKNLKGKDFEAHCVVGRSGGEYYALDLRSNRGHQPLWTVATALELARRWRVMRIGIIAVGYEIVLEGILRTEMQRRGIFHPIVIIPTNQKSKFVRITGALSGPAAHGKLHVLSSMSNLISQWNQYGPAYSGHDDELEAFAAGVADLTNPYLEAIGETSDEYDGAGDDFSFARGAP